MGVGMKLGIVCAAVLSAMSGSVSAKDNELPTPADAATFSHQKFLEVRCYPHTPKQDANIEKCSFKASEKSWRTYLLTKRNGRWRVAYDFNSKSF